MQRMTNGAAASAFPGVFYALKPILTKYAQDLAVAVDTPVEYMLQTKSPSPFRSTKDSGCSSGR